MAVIILSKIGAGNVFNLQITTRDLYVHLSSFLVLVNILINRQVNIKCEFIGGGIEEVITLIQTTGIDAFTALND